MDNLIFATTPQKRIILIDTSVQMTVYQSCILTDEEFNKAIIPETIDSSFFNEMSYDGISMDGGLLNDYFTDGRWSKEEEM